MKWRGRRQSSNIDDRRGQGGPRQGFGGFNPTLLGPLLRSLFSKTGLFIVGAFIMICQLMRKNQLRLITQFLGGGLTTTDSSEPYSPTAEEEELSDFSATILANTEDVWNQLLDNYREPT